MIRRDAPPAVGAVLAVAGWGLGSVPLALAGLGLAVAGVVAALWARVARRTIRLERDLGPTVLVEGDSLRYQVLLRGAALLPGTIDVRDAVGQAVVTVRRVRRRSPTAVVVPSLARGVHPIGPGVVTLTDPLGLARVEVAGPEGPTVRVRPRVVLLDATFVEGGRGREGGSRRAVLRTSGTEPHGVREYREGESLRAVHWASSARRGRLMVREMEEPPRDDAVVVLDLDAGGASGPPGGGSIDEVVRVGAALAHADVARGRRVGLVLAGARPLRIGIPGPGPPWEEALDALAGAMAVEHACTAELLRGGGREVRDGALVLVTARPVGSFADALLRRGAAAVVAVDAPTYAGRSPSAADPGLLRLAAHGVPVAVVRCGDDLGDVLSATRLAARA